MLDCFVEKAKRIILLHLTDKESLKTLLESESNQLNDWVKQNGFKANADTFCMIPESLTSDNKPWVVYGTDKESKLWSLGSAAGALPEADYQLVAPISDHDTQEILIGWALGSYQFDRYQKSNPRARLVVSNLENETLTIINSVNLVRDLINTPASDMMPEDLGEIMQSLAKKNEATFDQVDDKKRLIKKYPLIEAVGRASVHRPRLLKLCWGNEANPHIVLVGKGICFDSGGLDIKPASGMRYMQKDMGGAAHVIGLASLIMTNRLPVKLTVLVAAAENAIAGNAFRPGDILTSRSGQTVEIDNTDAEGRLVLADPLHEASEMEPDLIIDFATLTGAARVAVGTEIAAMFSNDAEVAIELAACGDAILDPVWQLPLHKGYKYELKSDRADLKNCASSGFGGAITAALFLQEFITDSVPWVHMDVMAWNNRKRPGRPKGGEAMGLRAVFAYLQNRYG